MPVDCCVLPAVFASGHLRPFDLYLSVLGQAVSQIQVDETLVGNADFISHFFEVLHDILGQPHGHGFFQLRGIRIPAEFQFGEVIFGFHIKLPR